MFSLIRSEIYRLLRKKSLYIYFGVLAVGYFVLVLIRSSGLRESSIVSDALILFALLPALAGGFLFAAIYTDDLNSKNLISLVGFGVPKATIIIAKFLLMTLFGIIIFGLVPLYHCAVYAAFGQKATSDMVAMIFAASLERLLAVLAFGVLSGVVVYGLQRATFAIVSYLLLAFGVIGSLLSLALDSFAPDLVEHLISGITNRIFVGMISGGSIIMPIIEYIISVLVAVALSLIAFQVSRGRFS